MRKKDFKSKYFKTPYDHFIKNISNDKSHQKLLVKVAKKTIETLLYFG